jgi:hypothetical protein
MGVHHVDADGANELAQPVHPAGIETPAAAEADGGDAEVGQWGDEVVLPGEEVRDP